MLAQMAKKKGSTGDRHSKRWIIGLPKVYHALFEQLAAQNRRPITMEVSLALEAHLKEAGLWPPPEGAQTED